jgi:hypothetical protein
VEVVTIPVDTVHSTPVHEQDRGRSDVIHMVASYLDEPLASEQPTQNVVILATPIQSVSQTSYWVKCGVLLFLWDVLALSWVYLY